MSSNRPGRQRTGSPESGRTTRRGPRPLPKGTSLFTPNASPARQAAERYSVRPLLYLHQLPTWVPPIALAVLLVAGLAIKGPGGAVALCALAAVLGWLSAMSWPRLSSGGRAGRVLVIAVVLVIAGYQVTR